MQYIWHYGGYQPVSLVDIISSFITSNICLAISTPLYWAVRTLKFTRVKNQPHKCNIFGRLNCCVCLMWYTFRQLLSWATSSPWLYVCLYLELFKNYKALKVSERPKTVKVWHIWPYRGRPWELPPHAIHFGKRFSRATFALQTVCISLEPLQVIKL